jgi:hypothetical protein
MTRSAFALSLAGLVACLPVLADDTKSPKVLAKGEEVKVADLEDFALKAGGVTFNNFCLAELRGIPVAGRTNASARAAWGGEPEMVTLRLRGCYRSRGEGESNYTLTVVGLDAEGEPLWACQLNGDVNGQDAGALPEATAAVLPGTLRQTASVRFRARVVPAVATPATGN